MQSPVTPENPFYSASLLPQHAPPFDIIFTEHFEPAFHAGMAQHAAEIRAIATNEDFPTFGNTIVAMEKTGLLLDRVDAAFSVYAGASTNPEIQALEETLAPLLAAHYDAISLDPQLWDRIEVIWAQRDKLLLDPESARLLEVVYQGFAHSGALLNDIDKKRLKELNAEEATLSNAFTRKLLAASNAAALTTDSAADLDGLTPSQLAAAADLAKSRDLPGYALALFNTTQQPALAQLTSRRTRRALLDASLTRTEQDDENDTRATIARLAQLRAQKAALLGYPSYAAWKLEYQMARTPQAAIDFIDALIPAATARVAQELADIQAIIDKESKPFRATAADWEFYAEQVRAARFHLDDAQLRPYFELTRVLHDGVFHAATRLYGVTFTPRTDLPIWAPDVTVYELLNPDQTHLALFYFDPFKRDNKRGGAWMSSFQRQSRLLDATPIIYNVCNYPKPPVIDGKAEPTLLSLDEVSTLFHEFGHALHGLFSDVKYPTLSGTAVPRDFVEFPSQFNEHWAFHPEIFANYALHHATGEPMPADLVAKIHASETFNQGYALTEVLAAAQLDMAYHTLPADAPLPAPKAFQTGALERKNLLIPAVPPRYSSTYFAHIWGGGYAAGYYAYLWAELLDNAGYDWFERNGGLTRANGDRLRTMVLSRGNTQDPATMYEAWLGEKPSITPMLRKRGLIS
jgi:peptidyl-dipeptidase Dcp